MYNIGNAYAYLWSLFCSNWLGIFVNLSRNWTMRIAGYFLKENPPNHTPFGQLHPYEQYLLNFLKKLVDVIMNLLASLTGNNLFRHCEVTDLDPVQLGIRNNQHSFGNSQELLTYKDNMPENSKG
jgi:hypothetical protein